MLVVIHQIVNSKLSKVEVTHQMNSQAVSQHWLLTASVSEPESVSVSETGSTFVFEPDSASVSGLDSASCSESELNATGSTGFSGLTLHKQLTNMSKACARRCRSVQGALQQIWRSKSAILMSLSIIFYIFTVLWPEEDMCFKKKSLIRVAPKSN